MQITDDEARAIFEWHMTPPHILSVPFAVFHRCAEIAMKRPVWVHEFAEPEKLMKEYRHESI